MACFFSFLFALASTQLLAEEGPLVILSPHRKSIIKEYQKAFGEPLEVLDQGGTENDLRLLDLRFGQNPKSVGMDLFWGGGALSFQELERKQFLEPLPKDLLALIDPSLAHSKKDQWVITALSSFGIFYHKELLKKEQIPEPKTWEDLLDLKWRDRIALADPRKSGVSIMMALTIFKAYPWDKAWRILTGLAKNTKHYRLTSSDPVQSVLQGDVLGTMALDYYGIPKVAEHPASLGFVLPYGKTTLSGDPIGILKGTTRRALAEKFIKFVLSPEGQRILILKKGAPILGAPQFESIGRMAVTKKSYEGVAPEHLLSSNPFLTPQQFFSMDLLVSELSDQKELLQDLIGAIHVDRHKELKKTPDQAYLPPISESEFYSLSQQWRDPLVRQKAINRFLSR